jgi:hypothetical protein
MQRIRQHAHETKLIVMIVYKLPLPRMRHATSNMLRELVLELWIT